MADKHLTDDELVRAMRNMAAKFGLTAVMTTLAGGVVVPAVAFAILHARAGKEC